MKTAKEVREAKTRIINQGKLMKELINHKGYKLLEIRSSKRTQEAVTKIITSKNFEEFQYNKGFFDGLKAHDQEVKVTISRGLAQERQMSN